MREGLSDLDGLVDGPVAGVGDPVRWRSIAGIGDAVVGIDLWSCAFEDFDEVSFELSLNGLLLEVYIFFLHLLNTRFVANGLFQLPVLLLLRLLPFQDHPQPLLLLPSVGFLVELLFQFKLESFVAVDFLLHLLDPPFLLIQLLLQLQRLPLCLQFFLFSGFVSSLLN